MADVTKRLGQLFIVGFSGQEPPGPFLNFLAEEQIGGVILFAENCPTHNVTAENIVRIRAQYRETPPFVAIDQEGGRVTRLKGAPAEFRSAASYGAEGTVEHFVEDYRRAAVYMESLGINLNLAPVADIFSEKNNSCLKDRCFGEKPEEVVPFVQAAVKTSQTAGLLSCLKHFPGLGSSTVDPHYRTAQVKYDELVWGQREKLPFVAGVAAGADMIMTTHVRLTGLDDVIATGSSKIVRQMLREKLGFDGPVITDDLTLAGAAELGEIGPRTVAAFNAGHDLLLFGRDWEQAARAYDYFVDAYRRDEVSEDRIVAALGRVSGVKFKLDSSVLP